MSDLFGGALNFFGADPTPTQADPPLPTPTIGMNNMDPMAQYQQDPGSPKNSGGASSPNTEFHPGDHIEVWSKSLNNWCPGIVEHLEGPMVNVKFRAPNGNYLTKGVPRGHGELRLIK